MYPKGQPPQRNNLGAPMVNIIVTCAKSAH